MVEIGSTINFSNLRWRRYCGLQRLVQSKDELRRGKTMSRMRLYAHRGDDEGFGIGAPGDRVIGGAGPFSRQALTYLSEARADSLKRSDQYAPSVHLSRPVPAELETERPSMVLVCCHG